MPAISLIVIGYDDNQQLLKLRNSWEVTLEKMEITI